MEIYDMSKRTKFRSNSANNGTVALPDADSSIRSTLAMMQYNSIMRNMFLKRGKSGAGSGFGDRRDMEEICGYKENLTFMDYWETYNRQDIAGRVVETYPNYTWMRTPEVYERVDGDTTDFESSWADLLEEHRPFSELRKLDILAGIGTFGLMVIGVNDGKKLDTPLQPAGTGKRRAVRTIAYHRVFTQGEVKIVEWDRNPNSLRYGQPVMYEVTPGVYDSDVVMSRTVQFDSKDKKSVNTDDPFRTSFRVHYTRCQHFADNAMSGTVYATPRLQRVFNRMTDIFKIVAGSAEMFWQGAFGGLSFEMDAEAELSDERKQELKLEIDNFTQRLQRTLLLQGVKANSLTPTISSPKDHLDVQLTMVSVASEIPKRILAGSEMGKLSSTQDSDNWNERVENRSNNVANPYLLRPYVRFCIKNGIVVPPANNKFSVSWSKLGKTTLLETSRAAEYFTKALEQYCSSNLFLAMKFVDYLMYVWNYDTAIATKLAENFSIKDFERIRKESIVRKDTSLDVGSGNPTSKKRKSVKKDME